MACGGGPTHTTEPLDAGPTSFDFPTDDSADGLIAFFDALEYRGATWAAGKAAPSEPEASSLSPHGRDLIFYNHALRQSLVDGHGSTSDPHSAGSMVVKEIYTGDEVVGHAAMLRSNDLWIYFCTASENGRLLRRFGGEPNLLPTFGRQLRVSRSRHDRHRRHGAAAMNRVAVTRAAHAGLPKLAIIAAPERRLFEPGRCRSQRAGSVSTRSSVEIRRSPLLPTRIPRPTWLPWISWRRRSRSSCCAGRTSQLLGYSGTLPGPAHSSATR